MQHGMLLKRFCPRRSSTETFHVCDRAQTPRGLLMWRAGFTLPCTQALGLDKQWNCVFGLWAWTSNETPCNTYAKQAQPLNGNDQASLQFKPSLNSQAFQNWESGRFIPRPRQEPNQAVVWNPTKACLSLGPLNICGHNVLMSSPDRVTGRLAWGFSWSTFIWRIL